MITLTLALNVILIIIFKSYLSIYEESNMSLLKYYIKETYNYINKRDSYIIKIYNFFIKKEHYIFRIFLIASVCICILIILLFYKDRSNFNLTSCISELIIIILLLIALWEILDNLQGIWKSKKYKIFNYITFSTVLVAIAFIAFVLVAEIFNLASLNKFCKFNGELNYTCVASVIAIAFSTAVPIILFIFSNNNNIKLKKEYEKREKKEFINKLSENLSTYISDISKYFFSQLIENKHNKTYINRQKAIQQYFLLKIMLKENNLAEKFLFWIEQMQHLYSVYAKDGSLDKKNETYLTHFNTNKLIDQTKQLEECTNKILEEFNIFSNKYIE